MSAEQQSRKAFVRDAVQLAPESLVGSWCHRLENERIVWQGVVVAEPQAGMYLVEVERLDVGANNVQVVVPLTAMAGDDDANRWRFYDTEQLARGAYAEWVSTTTEREATR